jgi:hypothetical protein
VREEVKTALKSLRERARTKQKPKKKKNVLWCEKYEL